MVLQQNKLPGWCRIPADDLYVNGYYIVAPYSGNSLSVVQDSFKFYLSSCLIGVKQAFGMLVSQFGIFWSPLRYSMANDTLIVMMACKLHNFITESCDLSFYKNLELAAENKVNGMPLVHSQDSLHPEQDNLKSRQHGRENARNMEEITECPSVLGLVRPRLRP